MKPKTMILMVVAIVCGLGASYMTSQLIARNQGGPQQVEMDKYLVAKKNLDLGTPLKNAEELFEFKEVPKNQVPENAVKSFDGLKDQFLKRPIRKQLWITQDDLEKEPTVLPIPDGMRAVGLRMSLENIASGFASLPGSRVDVYSTIRRGNDDNTYSNVLLENVLVLAADTNSKRPEGGAATPANVVTVALKPEDALRVTLAKDLGTLTLVLRNFDDKAVGETPKITASDLLSGVSPSSEKKGEIVDVAGGSEPIVPDFPTPTPNGKNGFPSLDQQPKVKTWTVNIWDGHVRRRVQMTMNEHGEILEEDITGELGEAPGTPPSVSPANVPPAGSLLPKQEPRNEEQSKNNKGNPA